MKTSSSDPVERQRIMKQNQKEGQPGPMGSPVEAGSHLMDQPFWEHTRFITCNKGEDSRNRCGEESICGFLSAHVYFLCEMGNWAISTK